MLSISIPQNMYLGHTYTKHLFTDDLKCKLNWASRTLSGGPQLWGTQPCHVSVTVLYPGCKDGTDTLLVFSDKYKRRALWQTRDQDLCPSPAIDYLSELGPMVKWRLTS